MMHVLFNAKGSEIPLLPLHCKRLFIDTINLLDKISGMKGIMLGGSLTYKSHCSGADADVFCLVEDCEIAKEQLVKKAEQLSELDIIISQGSFPWMPNLYTVYFKTDPDFSFDISLIPETDIDSFFWEPQGVILSDKYCLIDIARKNQQKEPNYSKQPFLKSYPFSMSVITVKKITKNIYRDHLWNALEQSNILRRYIMQILRIYLFKDNDFLGRVDRDIEETIPEQYNMQLANTVAGYFASDIASKTLLLIEMLESLLLYVEETNESDYYGWICMQIKHEKNRLIHYANTNA